MHTPLSFHSFRALQTTHDYFGVLLRGEESEEGSPTTLATAIKEATGAGSPHSHF